MAAVQKDEDLETLPEAKQLENNGYGEILTSESDASSTQSPNCDFYITKISETMQGMVTEFSLCLLTSGCIVRGERLIMYKGNCKCRGDFSCPLTLWLLEKIFSYFEISIN